MPSRKSHRGAGLRRQPNEESVLPRVALTGATMAPLLGLQGISLLPIFAMLAQKGNPKAQKLLKEAQTKAKMREFADDPTVQLFQRLFGQDQ